MHKHKKMHGIDVSHWEGTISFRQVKRAGIRLVYIKSTQGKNLVDPDFERNYTEAFKANLHIGFYHYVTARSLEDAKAEAAFFAEKIKGKYYDARPVMDFESFGELSRKEIHAISLHFLTELEKRTGHRPAIYSNASDASEVFTNERLREYPLWIAEYQVQRPDMENQWKRWSGWQYTESGHVRGIDGEVDRDYFRREILL